MENNSPASAKVKGRFGRLVEALLRRDLSWIPAALCFPLGVIGALAARVAVGFRAIEYERMVTDFPAFSEVIPPTEMPVPFLALCVVCGVCAVLLLFAAFAGLCRRRRWTLWFIRKGFAVVYALFIYYAGVVMNITGKIPDAAIQEFTGRKDVAVWLFFFRYHYLWLPATVVVLVAFLHVISWRRKTINLYTGERDEAPARGDLILENIRTHGRDPEYRRSTYTSSWSHLLVIVIIPMLLRMYGCVDPYKPPFGGGKAAVQMVQKVIKKKKKKRKRYILPPDSAIIFRIPDLDDSKIMQQVEEETQVRYTADASAAHGVLGDGKASTPGWADGFKDGMVRFIRMEYNGEEWDDGMDSLTRADMNFLEKFREYSGGMKIAKNSEKHPIHLLRRYPKGMAPPFVYMTGRGRIDVSEGDIKVMREYLMEGGMLFADCAGPEWHRNFMGFVARLFPGLPFTPIAHDDPIFQIPFTFPNGAPPLWHHGGTRAMGVKYKNRWVVFYHPGDMNDAWKTGHSGLQPDLAEASFQLGVNVVYYSFMNYIRETRKYRK